MFEQSGQGIAALAFYDDGGMLTFTRAGELYSVRRVDATLAQRISPSSVEVRKAYLRFFTMRTPGCIYMLEGGAYQ